MISAFVSTNKGLEELLAKELEELGATDITKTNAGAKFTSDIKTIMKINLYSRFASRVMIQVLHDEYHDEQDIYSLAYNFDWQKWFKVENSIKIKTTAINCPLKSLDFITLKVKDAICDKFVSQQNIRPNVDKISPDIKIYNFLDKNTITIYIDTSGEGLFKRGYRQDKLEAPLKENLAAGLVTLSNWDANLSFLDPMCGSGTILIEALSKALNIAPGLNRRFAFEKIRYFDIDMWNVLKQEAKNKINYDITPKIYANDISGKAIQTTKLNLEFFISQLINLSPQHTDKINKIFATLTFSIKNILEYTTPDSSGILITNPPYGVRLDDQEKLVLFYPQLATYLKNNFANWNCYILTNDLQMPKLMRLKPSKKIPLVNGALECRLFEFKMVNGSNRT